ALSGCAAAGDAAVSPALIRLLPVHRSIGPRWSVDLAAGGPLSCARTASPRLYGGRFQDALRPEHQP
ncbi:hypothetical protein EIJ50_18715, partial [Xanthomonas perforans]